MAEERARGRNGRTGARKQIRSAGRRWIDTRCGGERWKERESEGNSRRDVEREPMRLSREDEALRGRKGKGREGKGAERTRSPSVRNETREEEEAGCGIERRRKKRANRDNECNGESEEGREKEMAIRRTEGRG